MAVLATRPAMIQAAESLTLPQSSRANADDRLSLDSLGRVECGDRIPERSHLADVRPQPTTRTRWTSSVNWARSGTTTKSIARPARGPRLCRAGNGHQRPSGANQGRGPLRDVAAEDIENQIDLADIF